MNQIVNQLLPKISPESQLLIAKDIANQLDNKISQNKENSFQYLSKNIFPKIINPNLPVLAIDLGGTNLRIAIFYVIDSQEISKFKIKKINIQKKYKNTNLSLLNDFISKEIVDYLKELDFIDQEINIGMAFSFPFVPTKNKKHIDADRTNMLMQWGKDFVIKDANKNITFDLRKKLIKLNVKVVQWITINDSIATLIESNSDISVLLGTGFNVGIKNKESYYNLEAGFYSSKALTKTHGKFLPVYLKKIIKNNDFANKDLEYILGGNYLGNLLVFLIQKSGVTHNTDTVNIIKRYKAEAISLLINKNYDFLKTNLDKNQKDFLTQFATRIRDRSICLTYSFILGAIDFLKINNGIVSVDGAVAHNLVGFSVGITKKLKNSNFTVKTTSNSALKSVAKIFLKA